MIQKHKQQLWKEHLTDNWDHRSNTHKLWNKIAALNNKTPTQVHNNSIKFNKFHATTNAEKAQHFNKQFTNTTKYSTTHNNRVIDKKIKKLQKTQVTISEQGTKQAIQQAKDNNSTGLDDINIRHLKNI